MAWTTPATWTAGQVVSASDMNAQIRDNMTYLLTVGSPPAAIVREGGADYTVTGTTWTNVDATNLKLTFTIAGSKIWGELCFRGQADNTASSEAQFDVILDGTTRFGGTNGVGWTQQNTISWIAYPFYFTGLSAGSHNVQPQFRNKTAGAVTTIQNNAHPVSIIAWGA